MLIIWNPREFSRLYNLHSWYWNSLLWGLISSEENSAHFLQLMPFAIFFFLFHQVPITAGWAECNVCNVAVKFLNITVFLRSPVFGSHSNSASIITICWQLGLPHTMSGVPVSINQVRVSSFLAGHPNALGAHVPVTQNRACSTLYTKPCIWIGQLYYTYQYMFTYSPHVVS